MGKRHSRTKKTLKELNSYKNMLKYKIEDDYTEENAIFNSLQGTAETSQNNTFNDKNEEKVQSPPIGYKVKDWFETYSGQIIFGLIGTALLWNVTLQIGQATQDEKIRNLEEDVQEIKTTLNDKYLIKDIHDIQVENLEKQIEGLEKEIEEVKIELNDIKK